MQIKQCPKTKEMSEERGLNVHEESCRIMGDGRWVAGSSLTANTRVMNLGELHMMTYNLTFKQTIPKCLFVCAGYPS